MFDIDLDDLDAGDAERAGQDLSSEQFNVRRDACRALGDLGDASKAEPFLLKLKELATGDPDYEVKKAARKAVADLRQKGAKFPEPPARAAEPEPSEAEGAAAAAGPSSSLTYAGPKLLLEVFKEVLPMRADREGGPQTPAELAAVWEKSWGVLHAGRIKFEAPEGSPTKWLNPRDDVVPRSPFVVRLACGVGSVLLALATALKVYGLLTDEEIEAEKERKSQEKAAGAERRQEADGREKERWRQLEHRRQQRQAGELPASVPFVRSRPLAEEGVAGLR